MKFLPTPAHDDHATLDGLKRTNYRHDAAEIDLIAAAYVTYRLFRGQANALSAINLPAGFKSRFKNLYTSDRDEMSYISDLREAEDVLSCPMCGSAQGGTLDHIFPVSVFPEFSIFSKNLVPACFGCNTKRGNAHVAVTGARVLHPYFDRFLDDHLIYTTLTSQNNSYDRPHLDIALVDPWHPNAADINFHVDNIVKKTRIKVRQTQMWNSLKKGFKTFLRTTTIPTNDTDFLELLHETIGNADSEFENRNNWKSMLFYGVAQNRPCRDFLIAHWQGLGI